MKTMKTQAVVQWVEAKLENKLAQTISRLYTGKEVVDTERLDAIFYLTLGSRKGPELFREMQCEVITTLNPGL
jgi:hypothetical protein